MKKEQLKKSLLLLLTALIWGFAFVAQSVGMEYVEPFTFNCVRFLIGGLTLIPCIALIRRTEAAQGEEKSQEEKKEEKANTIRGGICCGIALCVASSLQQMGLLYTTAGKAGFITACYILFVPVIGIFFRKKCGPLVWLGVALAVLGLYFLCITDGLKIGRGDFLVFLCALAFSGHILIIDHFAPKADGLQMSCIQFFVSGILCILPMLLTEQPKLANLLAAWQPILYAGVLSCGVAYTLQIFGQKGMNPTVASLLLSLESVFSVVGGALILHQMLSGRELLGCVLMFGAILLAQLPSRSQ